MDCVDDRIGPDLPVQLRIHVEIRAGGATGATLLLTRIYLKATEHGWYLDVGRFSESEPELLIPIDPRSLEFPKVDGQTSK